MKHLGSGSDLWTWDMQCKVWNKCTGSATFWVRIRIRGSVPLTNGSGSGSRSWKIKSHTEVTRQLKSRVFLLLLLDVGRIRIRTSDSRFRIREAQKLRMQNTEEWWKIYVQNDLKRWNLGDFSIFLHKLPRYRYIFLKKGWIMSRIWLWVQNDNAMSGKWKVPIPDPDLQHWFWEQILIRWCCFLHNLVFLPVEMPERGGGWGGSRKEVKIDSDWDTGCILAKRLGGGRAVLIFRSRKLVG